MAEIKDGILGGVHGKIGPVVGFMWRGRYFLRSTPSKSNKSASEKQIAQRSKLSLVSTFANKVKDFVNANYPLTMLNDKMATGKEQLISMLMKEGILKIEGELCLDIASVLLSIGTLPPAVIKKIGKLKTGKIKVQWDNAIMNILTKDSDRLTIIAYSEKLLEFKEIESIAKREDKYVHFDLPNEWVEGNVHFWSVWKSADGKLVSTSAYHGVTELNEIVEVENAESEEKSVEVNTVSGKLEAENGVEKTGKGVFTSFEGVKEETIKLDSIEIGTIDDVDSAKAETQAVENMDSSNLINHEVFKKIEDYEPQSILEALKRSKEQNE
ncbi:DUF6266 family protein [Myroides sp. M-43]|uniref:DUF6266 family protein n=1 Tax=Myroides oncorhynchi TaxID=2893756 RepID=UPI001E2B430C|nr:DUF6266 family protein [Myroides oncorhynchi]MCC9042377.1 DUF6266 family protein [Myroides oncorhynchi]